MSSFVRVAAAAVIGLALGGCQENPSFPQDGSVLSQAARHLHSPSVVIVSPDARRQPAAVPAIFTVRWTAENAKSVRWILLDLTAFGNDLGAALQYARADAPQWSEWKHYEPHQGEGIEWQSPPTASGRYVFAVQARNARGDTTEIVMGHNAMQLLVAIVEGGPILIVGNPYFQPIGSNCLEVPPTVVDIPAGVAMGFTLRAFADHYGGTVQGYRFGWDIVDLNDDAQWDIDFTPFPAGTASIPPRMYFFGSHTFQAEAIDNSGFRSRVTIRLNVLPVTMERPLLVVDDWVEGEGSFETTNGRHPSDAEHDAFWVQMTLDVAGFQPAVDTVELLPGQIPTLSFLLGYRNIIWNASGSPSAVVPSVLGDIVRWKDIRIPHFGGGQVTPNLIGLYMATGGHVMLCGEQLMVLSIGGFAPKFPIILRYEITGDQDGDYEDSDVGSRGAGDNLFAYHEGCLNVLDVAYLTPLHQRRRDGNGVCSVAGVRSYDPGTEGLRACEPLVNAAGGTFPRLELRPEVGEPGRFFEEGRTGVNSDIYNPPYFRGLTPGHCESLAEYGRLCFQPIYGLEGTDRASAIYHAPVTYWTGVFQNRAPSAGGVAARSVIWGFHPVYFHPHQVKAAMDVILFEEWRLARR